MSEETHRSRLGVIGVIVVVLFAGLFVRLWFLQVATVGELRRRRTANRIRVISEPAVRGSILDRNGKVIVKSELVEQRPDPPRDHQGGAQGGRLPALAKVLGKTEKFIDKRLDSVAVLARTSRCRSPTRCRTRRSCTSRSAGGLPARRCRACAASACTRTARSRRTCSGTSGAINAQEQKLHKDDGYGPEDVIGKDGVEQMFETELRGAPRAQARGRRRGRFVREISDRPGRSPATTSSSPWTSTSSASPRSRSSRGCGPPGA